MYWPGNFTKERIMPNDEMQRLWQCQSVEVTPIDMENIRRKAGRLHGRVRNRNLRETIAGLVAIVILTWFGLGKADLLQRTSFALLDLGMVYVLWHLWRYGTANALPADLGLTDAITFHRRELTHQRDLLRRIFWWYLAPFFPGWAVGAVSAMRHSWIPAAGMLVFVSAVTWFVWRLNRRAADCLDREITELSRFQESQ
jgi:hypothetical protein